MRVSSFWLVLIFLALTPFIAYAKDSEWESILRTHQCELVTHEENKRFYVHNFLGKEFPTIHGVACYAPSLITFIVFKKENNEILILDEVKLGYLSPFYGVKVQDMSKKDKKDFEHIPKQPNGFDLHTTIVSPLLRTHIIDKKAICVNSNQSLWFSTSEKDTAFFALYLDKCQSPPVWKFIGYH